MTWHERFDRLLKAMSEGEPHKAEKRASKSPRANASLPDDSPSDQDTDHNPAARS
jgi:hypothetical protein